MKKMLLVIIILAFTFSIYGQNGLVSGPWVGNVELRTATIWAEVQPTVKQVVVRFSSVQNPKKVYTVVYRGTLGSDFNPVKIDINGLDFNTTYSYQLLLDGKPVAVPFATQFTTKDLWQYRKAAPDFSFLAGSCAYFNEPIFDRPGKGYGGDSSMFETMAKTPAAFHIWMGDNWYTREVDYSSVWGLNYRASRDRSMKVLQKFMASMPQYAIWDDHDYGPNDAHKDYIFRDESREIFKNYSTNPSYGQNGQGIYTTFSYSDADFFLTDDRYFRSEPGLKATDVKPTFFGSTQMDWLKNSLKFSNATFKFIIVGSQVLNPLNKFECMTEYPDERNELLNFIAANKIRGVIFLSGDRHHSEVIKLEREGAYPLYDVTLSPYTAGISKARDEEANNPYRIEGTLVEEQNFGKLTITGAKGDRKVNLQMIGLKGNVLGTWSVNEKDLK